MTTVHDRFFVLGVLLLLITSISCNDRKNIIDEPLYEGPLVSMDSIYTKMSDSAKVILRMKAPKQDNFENGDREWSKGLFLEYLDDKGEVVSTF
ncbi:MAG: hypothetical protein RJQ14_16690, partial [Marinoscillum sp.]